MLAACHSSHFIFTLQTRCFGTLNVMYATNLCVCVFVCAHSGQPECVYSAFKRLGTELVLGLFLNVRAEEQPELYQEIAQLCTQHWHGRDTQLSCTDTHKKNAAHSTGLLQTYLVSLLCCSATQYCKISNFSFHSRSITIAFLCAFHPV